MQRFIQLSMLTHVIMSIRGLESKAGSQTDGVDMLSSTQNAAG